MKTKIFVVIPLLIVIAVISGLLYARIIKRSFYNGEKVAKIEVLQLVSEGEPVSVLTLTDKKSIGTVLAAVNHASENVGRKTNPNYKAFGVSTHLIEIYGENNVKYNIYIALGPNNQGTSCYIENEQHSFTIGMKDTSKLRKLILNK